MVVTVKIFSAFDLMAMSNDVLESGMRNWVLRQTITVPPYYYDIF